MKKNKPDSHNHRILLLYQLLFYILEFVLPTVKIFPLQEDFLNCKHLQKKNQTNDYVIESFFCNFFYFLINWLKFNSIQLMRTEKPTIFYFMNKIFNIFHFIRHNTLEIVMTKKLGFFSKKLNRTDVNTNLWEFLFCF